MAGFDQTGEIRRAFSLLFGWIYTLSWSVSFYPQVILNWQRRSTKGAAIGFPFLNVIGFSCYTFCIWTFLYSSSIRTQYAVRHPRSPEPTTRFNDFVFGAHALILVLVTYSQYYTRIWGFEVPQSQRISRPIMMLVGGCAILVMAVTCLVLLHNGVRDQDATTWAWIDVIYAIGNVKVIVTFFKYVPQVIMNYQRKSTVGWSIGTILFDFVGGILSLAQLIIDSSLQRDWSGLAGNPLKLGIGNIGVAFDIIFIVQHYILYHDRREKERRGSNDSKDERSPLLRSV